MRKIFYTAKSFVSNDLIEIIASVIMSTLLETIRRIIIYLKITDGDIGVSSVFDVFDIETVDSVVSIVLLTLIIWGVTGLAKTMEKENHEKKRKIHTLFMFVIFILSIFWYVLKILFSLNTSVIIISMVFCVLLVVILTTYLANNSLPDSNYQTDNRIA